MTKRLAVGEIRTFRKKPSPRLSVVAECIDNDTPSIAVKLKRADGTTTSIYLTDVEAQDLSSLLLHAISVLPSSK